MTYLQKTAGIAEAYLVEDIDSTEAMDLAAEAGVDIEDVAVIMEDLEKEAGLMGDLAGEGVDAARKAGKKFFKTKKPLNSKKIKQAKKAASKKLDKTFTFRKDIRQSKKLNEDYQAAKKGGGRKKFVKAQKEARNAQLKKTVSNDIKRTKEDIAKVTDAAKRAGNSVKDSGRKVADAAKARFGKKEKTFVEKAKSALGGDNFSQAGKHGSRAKLLDKVRLSGMAKKQRVQQAKQMAIGGAKAGGAAAAVTGTGYGAARLASDD